jgi:hypothetical protein
LIIREETKQKIEDTRQLEIQLKIAEVQANKEIRLAELSKQREPEQKEIGPKKRKIKDGNLVHMYQAIDVKIPELLAKFLQEKTQVTQNENAYIFTKDLFSSFNEYNSTSYTIKYTMFFMILKSLDGVVIKPKSRKKLMVVIGIKFI